MRTKPYQTAIAVFDEVELLDVTGPVSVLSAAGRQWNFQPFKIDLVANGVGPVTTRSALALHATHDFARHTGAECLIVPGGYGARLATEDEALLAWLRRSAAEAVLVAAIGNGALLLAKAGLLDQVQVAASVELALELGALCPSAQPNSRDPVCSSGKILTARASALGLDLSCEMVARCFGNKLASSLSAALGIDWAGELGSLDIVAGPLLVPPGNKAV
ncbi:MAG: DJ-1/PfpI family protein [Pseudomonadota bacterium]